MFKHLVQIWNSTDLRKKILFTIGIIIIYRVLSHITVPGASIEALKEFANRNALLQIFSLLTGGSISYFSIVLMGISPYINASIIIQLLTVVVPKLDELNKEGETGRRKLNSYTRWLTLPLAFFQSYGMLVLLNTQSQTPIIDTNSIMTILPIMMTITAGTILLVWLGELITEKGIGNGISLLIFCSIISEIPDAVGRGLFLAQEDQSRVIPFILILLVSVILTTIVILVTEAMRRVPLTYAGRGIRSKSDQAFLPIRINQAGMIPIIFAVALISFPGIIGQFLTSANSAWLRGFGENLTKFFVPNTVTYLVIYFLLVVGFTFFYVSITFKPDELADNIQKRGGYIPGIRPGKQTAEYIKQVSDRLTFFGALFIAIIAVLPLTTQFFFNVTAIGSVPLLISGAGIIIIVGVVLELIRQVNAQMVMHDYKRFY